MGTKTGISWTDHTFNPWWGCTKISPGCDNCYAASFDHRVGGDHWGKDKPRREFGYEHWNEPFLWDRAAAAADRRDTVFCASMADVMDDEAPIGGRDRLWELIDSTPNLIWQLLTKRPHRYNSCHIPNHFRYDNVWLGTSCENQHFYDVRWPILRRACDHHGLVSWISYEPALGPLVMRPKVVVDNHYPVPDWIICGGESGGGRRPFEQKWAEDLMAECQITTTKFFMKQMGASTPKKGSALIPAHLLVRQFPAVRA